MKNMQNPREWAIVAVMSLGFGLVGIDRFMISTLYPVIATDLNLNYSDIGTITGALAIAWGIAALFIGNLSDRIGRRIVLTTSLVVFSLLIGTSGLAHGLLSLVLVRVVMGFADGAYTPASISATLAASRSGREGLNIGIQQTMLPLFGLGIAPLLIGELMHVINWRWIFLVFAVPGLVLAWLVWRVIPRQDAAVQDAHADRNSLADWRTVVRYRNIRIGMVMMLCWLTCLITTSAFLPSYLMNHHGLELATMSRIMAAIGLGSMFGTILLPWLSDWTGRKPIFMLSTLGALAGLILLAMEQNNAGLLFAWLFMVHFFNNALITLTVGPLCSETVPASLMATATGVVIAAGELFGGGIAPILAGFVADHYGIDQILYLPIAAMGTAVLLSFLIIETSARRRASF